MAVVLGMPFVSGKDSMKNDAVVNWNNQKTKISVLPTLLVTAMAHMPDVNKTVHSRYKTHEDLWLLGDSEDLNPFTLSTLMGQKHGAWKGVKPLTLKKRYQDYFKAVQKGLISGGHDVSEGGALIALIEMAINSEAGFNLELSGTSALFGEGMGRIVFSSPVSVREKIRKHFQDIELNGSTRSDQRIVIGSEELSFKSCVAHYMGTQA